MSRVEGRGVKRRGGRPHKVVEERPSEAGQRPEPQRPTVAYLRFTDRRLFRQWEPKTE